MRQFYIIPINGHRELSHTREDRLGYEGRGCNSVSRVAQVRGGGYVPCPKCVNKVLSPHISYKTKGALRNCP